MAQGIKFARIKNYFEREVFEFLVRNLPDEYVVLSSLRVPGNGREIDSVVIGPNGVFTIEAKAYEGKVSKGANTSISIETEDGFYSFEERAEDPAVQAEIQAKVLSGFFRRKLGLGKVWVKSLLVFKSGTTFDVPPEYRDISYAKFQPFIVNLDETVSFITQFRPPTRGFLSARLIHVLVKALRDGPEKLEEEERNVLLEEERARPNNGYKRTFANLTPPRSTSPQINAPTQKAKWRAVAALIAVIVLLFMVGAAYAVSRFTARFGKALPSPTHKMATLAQETPTPVSGMPAVYSSQVPSYTPALPSTVLPSTSAPVIIPSPTVTESPFPTATRSKEWKVTKGGLSLTVERIELRKNGFRVWMKAVNDSSNTLALPLYMNFFVVDNLGHQYQADPFASTFPTQVAPGATVEGFAYMRGPLDKNASTVKVMFSTVYGSFDVTTISIDNIPVP